MNVQLTNNADKTMNKSRETMTNHRKRRGLSMTIARYRNMGKIITNRLGMSTSGRLVSGHVTDRLTSARRTE